MGDFLPSNLKAIDVLLCDWALFWLGFFFFYLSFIYLFIYFTILYWFCHTLTWIQHGFTCVPHPEPPPTSLPIPSLWVIPVHQPRAPCIMWLGLGPCSLFVDALSLGGCSHHCSVADIVFWSLNDNTLKTIILGVLTNHPKCFPIGCIHVEIWV